MLERRKSNEKRYMDLYHVNPFSESLYDLVVDTPSIAQAAPGRVALIFGRHAETARRLAKLTWKPLWCWRKRKLLWCPAPHSACPAICGFHLRPICKAWKKRWQGLPLLLADYLEYQSVRTSNIRSFPADTIDPSASNR